MDVTEIKKLMSILDETDVTEISLESEGTKVLLKKDMFAKKAKIEETVVIEQKEEKEELDLRELISLNVGRFFLGDKKGNPVVKIGDSLKEGQIVGYIEAIGVRTEVKSDVEGILKEMIINDGETTEFGQILMIVEIK